MKARRGCNGNKGVDHDRQTPLIRDELIKQVTWQIKLIIYFQFQEYTLNILPNLETVLWYRLYQPY